MNQAEPHVGDRMGRYVLVEVLGRGGMGTVFRARDEQLERDVAVKVILPGLAADAEFRERFRREAVTLSQMDSPHVVAVFDHGEQSGAAYLVTQLVRGGDLLALVRTRGALEPAYAVDLTTQVLRGLADAHAAGVVHRDVKPSNVLLREDGRVAYLCDFGIASSPGVDLTRTGAIVGSTAYMAPERHAGETAARAGVAADVYAAGCLLWHLLTGTQPYVGTEGEVAMGHLRGPVPQLPAPPPVAAPDGTLVEDADAAAFVAGLNRVVARAMAKDPAQRYPTAKAMAHELAALASLAPGALVLPDVTAVRQSLVLPEPAPAPAPTPTRPPWRRVVVTAVVVALVATGVYVGSRLGGVPVGPTLASDAASAPSGPSGTAVDPTSPTSQPEAPTPSPDAGSSMGADGTGPAAAAPLPERPAASTPRPRTAPQRATPKPTRAATKPSSAPATSAAPAAPTPKFRCWNGATKVKLADCPLPTGRAGAVWVFPGLGKLTGCVAVDKSASAFVEGWECRRKASDGTSMRVSFSRWTSASAAIDRYWAGYADGGARSRNDWVVGGRVYGRAMQGKMAGLYHSTRVYVGNGTNAWVFAAAANTASRRDSMLRVTTFRAPGQFRGVPLG